MKNSMLKITQKTRFASDGVRLVPVELIDIAGIVPGAWEGRGLGNQFLDEIRRADALIHVVDASGGTDCEGQSCKPGEHDPLEDVKFLEREITMWMVTILKKDWSKIARTAEADKKGIARAPRRAFNWFRHKTTTSR